MSARPVSCQDQNLGSVIIRFMSLRMNCRSCVLALVLSVLPQLAMAAATPADQLLPSSTKGAVLIPSWDKLETAFDATQIGQLLLDPVMKPFVDDLKIQLKSKGSQRLEKLGVTVDDLRAIHGGEIALALTLPKPNVAAIVLIIDVTGHETEAAALQVKVSKNLLAQGGQLLGTKNGIGHFRLARGQGDTKDRFAANFLKKQSLVLTDDLATAELISAALDQPRVDSLKNIVAYQAIGKKLTQSSGDLQPQVRWYLDPFGYTEAMRVLDPPDAKPQGTADLLKVLRNQGFAAVLAIGGHVNFSTGQQELLHRTFVYAPGNTTPGAERFTLGARLLDFPATTDLHVQPWIPREIATYATFNWKLRERFPAAETLVDEYVGGKGTFRDVLDSLSTEPDGPKVDIEKEIIANLSQRFTLMTDYQLPINQKSERLLVGIEIDLAKNNQPEQTVSNAIKRMMQSDARVRPVQHNGITIWETVQEKANVVPELQISVQGGAIQHDALEPTAFQAPAKGVPGKRLRPGQKGPNGKPVQKDLPNSAVAVANGHLYIASHVDILIKVINHASQVKAQTAGIIAVGKTSPSLDSSSDLNMILLEMEQGFHAKEICFRHFSRTDEEYRPTYELMRNGQMPTSETVFGKMLNSMFGDKKPGAGPREQKIDASKLPEFDVVRRYLGPAGAFMTVEQDGWLLTGFTLRKTLTAAELKANQVR